MRFIFFLMIVQVTQHHLLKCPFFPPCTSVISPRVVCAWFRDPLFYSFGTVCLSLMPVPCCPDFCSFMASCLVDVNSPTLISFPLLSRLLLVSFFDVHLNFRIIITFQEKKGHLAFWLGLHWIYRLIQGGCIFI